MITKIKKWFKQFFCSHLKTDLIHIDYPDRYMIKKCKNCKLEIYSDLD